MSAELEVVEYTDPASVWSWSSEPALRWLRWRYGERARWRRVFGAPDACSEPPQPEHVRARWLDVAAHTDAPIGERLEWAHVSPRLAAVAARAAEHQGRAVADAVLRRLREAFFVDGRPPDTPARLADALAGVQRLDLPRLLRDLDAPDVRWSLDADAAETRRPRPEVIGLRTPGPHPGAARRDGERWRYAFPTLRLRGPAGERVVPGWRAGGEYRAAVEAVAPALAGLRAPALSAAEALERHRSLSAVELELLTGDAAPPRFAVRLETATAPLWLHPDEARARGLAASAARVAT